MSTVCLGFRSHTGRRPVWSVDVATLSFLAVCRFQKKGRCFGTGLGGAGGGGGGCLKTVYRKGGGGGGRGCTVRER